MSRHCTLFSSTIHFSFVSVSLFVTCNLAMHKHTKINDKIEQCFGGHHDSIIKFEMIKRNCQK